MFDTGHKIVMCLKTDLHFDFDAGSIDNLDI